MSSPALSRYSEDAGSERGGSVMTWLQAAEQVLRDEGPDMHIRDLTARIMELGIVKSNCATSLETLLYRQTSSSNINSKFVRVIGKHGWFGLRDDYFDLPSVKNVNLEVESDPPAEEVENERELKPPPPSIHSMLENINSYNDDIEPRVFYNRKRARSYFSSEDSCSSDDRVTRHKRNDSSSDEESTTDASAYRKKYYFIKKLAESMIYENAALVEQLARINKQITRAEAEKKFLLKKLVGFERVAQKTKATSVVRASPKPEVIPKPTKAPRKKPVVPKQTSKPVPQRKPEVRSEVKNVRPGGSRKLVMSESSPSSESDSDEQDSAPIKKSDAKSKGASKDEGGKLELAMRCGKVRRLHPIALHEDGSPVFPIVIGGLRVHNLGKIVHDRPAYHSERYLLPVGFESSRTYPSMLDPSRKTVYTCRILDGGDTPLFEMVADDDHAHPVRAASSTACQTIVLRNINKARDKQATNSGSGPEFFGYSNPTILNLLQKIPESRKCFKYKFVRFALPQRRPKKTQAASVKPGPKRGAMTDIQRVKANAAKSSSLAIAPVFGGMDMISYSSSDEASLSSDGDLVIDS